MSNRGGKTMSFADNIKELAKKAIAMQSDNYSADVAKTSLVLPYFQSLGYDIFNPKEFISGYGNANAKCYYHWRYHYRYHYSSSLQQQYGHRTAL